MTTTQQAPTDIHEQLRAHSPWCRTSECTEGTPGLEYHHQGGRVGELVPAGLPWRRMSVTVDRYAELVGQSVHHTTTVDLGLESGGPGRWQNDEAWSSLSPDEADELAAHLMRAATIARGTQQ